MSGMSKAKDSIALQVSLVDGGATATNLTLTGATTEDTILFVGHLTTKAAIESMADLTSEASITGDDALQLSTTVTTADQLWVFWVDNSK